MKKMRKIITVFIMSVVMLMTTIPTITAYAVPSHVDKFGSAWSKSVSRCYKNCIVYGCTVKIYQNHHWVGFKNISGGITYVCLYCSQVK